MEKREYTLYMVFGTENMQKLVALVLRRNKEGKQIIRSYAYIIWNFNEKTATVCIPIQGLLRINNCQWLAYTFSVLRMEVAEPEIQTSAGGWRFNLLPEVAWAVGYEIKWRKPEKSTYHFENEYTARPAMIDELYKAGEAGVRNWFDSPWYHLFDTHSGPARISRITHYDGQLLGACVSGTCTWTVGNHFFHGVAGLDEGVICIGGWGGDSYHGRKLKQEMIDMLHIQLRDNKRQDGWMRT